MYINIHRYMCKYVHAHIYIRIYVHSYTGDFKSGWAQQRIVFWGVCLYLYIYIHINIYSNMHIYICVCINMLCINNKYVYIHSYTGDFKSGWAHQRIVLWGACLYLYILYIHTYKYVYQYTYIHVYIYTCTHMYMHTYIYANTYINAQVISKVAELNCASYSEAFACIYIHT